MEHTNVISFYPSSAQAAFRASDTHENRRYGFESKQRLDRWMQAAELTVTGLIGAGFCFCIALVVTML